MTWPPQTSTTITTTTTTTTTATKDLDDDDNKDSARGEFNLKYKRSMMEKYMQDNEKDGATVHLHRDLKNNGAPQLNKWIESTANFMPDKHNYVDWPDRKRISSNNDMWSILHNHAKDELDAAETLTKLALC